MKSTKKKKDPNFDARKEGSYEAFEEWRKEKEKKEAGTKAKKVKKSFCFFDKEGHLWFRKSAFKVG